MSFKHQLGISVFCILACVGGLTAEQLDAEMLSFFHYRSIGPTRQGGRVVAFAVNPQDPMTFFVAAGPSGVWKTTNNGHSFQEVFLQEAISSIGDIKIAPSSSRIVWIGTGEANLRNSTYYGNGVYKSQDCGDTWQHMGLKETHHIGRIVIHPQKPDIVYIAAQGHLYSENPERGIFKTLDGGKTWNKVLSVKIQGRDIGAADLIMDPQNPQILYASTYDRQRWAWSFRTAGPGSRIYCTRDGGKSWIRLTNGLPKGVLGKIGLAVYPQDPRILYATVDNANSPGVSYSDRIEELFSGRPPSQATNGHEIYRSDNSGETWKRVSPEGKSIGNRSNYYGQIFVDPNDPDHVYVLSEKVDESLDGGKTWARAFEYAGDNHVLWIDPRDSRHMLLGYDYGMAITYDAGDFWYHPDELSMAQLYAIGVDMEYPYNVYGGMQDFGSWKGPSTKKGRFPIRFEDWEHMQGGDGFYNQVDPRDSRWLYSESQFGGLSRIDQKTGRRYRIGWEKQDLRFNWNAPFLLSPHNPDVILHGAQYVLRSTFRGENWSIISPDLTSNDPARLKGIGAVQYCTITTLDESALKPGLIWAGTDDGRLWVTRDSGKQWDRCEKNITDFPGFWITRVIASQHKIGRAYMTCSGFHRDDFAPYVYRTEDFGKSWTRICNRLPQDEAVNVIREDRKNPCLLFVGTDKSVYVTLDRGVSWKKMQGNMPTVPIHDLVIHPRENDLVVGTHGRGFYITDISPLQEISPEMLASEVHFFEIEPKVQWIMSSQKAVSAQNFTGENETHSVVINYYLKQPLAKAPLIQVHAGTRLINEFPGTNQPGFNRMEWGMTRKRKRTAEELKRFDRWYRFAHEDEEFFDYYDTVDWFAAPDQEVARDGRSLQTRVHMRPEALEREYKYFRVAPGTYTVSLIFADRVLRKKAVIYKDNWYDRRS